MNKFINNCFFVALICFFALKLMYLFTLLNKYFASAGCIMVFIAFLVLYTKREYVYKIIGNLFERIEKISFLKLLLFVIATSLVFKIIGIILCPIITINSGDVSVYANSANEIAQKGIVIDNAKYLWRYEHIFWFSYLLSPVVKIFGLSQTALSLYMALIITISECLIFHVCKNQGLKSVAFISLVVYNILPNQVLSCQYITHENALLLMISITLWLYFVILPKMSGTLQKAIIWLIISVFILFGKLVNAAGIVLLISILIITFIRLIEKTENLKTFLYKFVIILTVFMVGSNCARSIQFSLIEVPSDTVKYDKVLWTLYVGSNTDSYGGYSLKSQNEFSSFPSDYNAEQITQYRKELLKKSYINLVNNPKELIKLVSAKLIRLHGNSEYALIAGNACIENKTVFYFYNKYLFKPFAMIEYAILLLFTLLGIIGFNKYKFSEFYSINALYIMGITALLTLTECNNKYISTIYPLFLVLCLYRIFSKSGGIVNVTKGKTT